MPKTTNTRNENEVLKKQLKLLPHQPGCYLFLNKSNKIVYVGKAKDLTKRVHSYFVKVHNFKTTQLVRNIYNINYITTSNEKEALILEQNLIKKHHPRYNILLADDKRYPYIMINRRSADPSYNYVRKVNNNDGNLYFGPFPDGTGAREMLKFLQRIFPLYRCKKKSIKPCNYYLIGQCSGACFKKVDRLYYDKKINELKDFFAGNISKVSLALHEQMQKFANNLQYEAAGRIKRTLEQIDMFSKNQKVEFKDTRNRDFLGILVAENYLILSLLIYRGGKLQAVDHFVFDKFDNNNLNDVIESYLTQFYTVNSSAKFLYIPNNIRLSQAFVEFHNLVIVYPKQGKYKEILDLAASNTYEYWKQFNKTNSKANLVNTLLEELQAKAKLDTFPDHIDIFDVANLYDLEPVAGVVVYINGKRSLRNYRKYKLNPKNRSDYHRMQEAIFRHYESLLKKKQELANLIIVDGAKSQINAALTQLNKLNLKINLIGLVKNDKHSTDHIMLSGGEVIELDKTSTLYNFLARMQDEVHRFTITFHRKRRRTSALASILDSIPGLGTKRKEKLLLYFPTLTALKLATSDELTKIVRNKIVVKNLIDTLENI